MGRLLLVSACAIAGCLPDRADVECVSAADCPGACVSNRCVAPDPGDGPAAPDAADLDGAPRDGAPTADAAVDGAPLDANLEPPDGFATDAVSDAASTAFDCRQRPIVVPLATDDCPPTGAVCEAGAVPGWEARAPWRPADLIGDSGARGAYLRPIDPIVADTLSIRASGASRDRAGQVALVALDFDGRPSGYALGWRDGAATLRRTGTNPRVLARAEGVNAQRIEARRDFTATGYAWRLWADGALVAQAQEADGDHHRLFSALNVFADDLDGLVPIIVRGDPDRDGALLPDDPCPTADRRCVDLDCDGLPVDVCPYLPTNEAVETAACDPGALVFAVPRPGGTWRVDRAGRQARLLDEGVEALAVAPSGRAFAWHKGQRQTVVATPEGARATVDGRWPEWIRDDVVLAHDPDLRQVRRLDVRGRPIGDPVAGPAGAPLRLVAAPKGDRILRVSLDDPPMAEWLDADLAVDPPGAPPFPLNRDLDADAVLRVADAEADVASARRLLLLQGGRLEERIGADGAWTEIVIDLPGAAICDARYVPEGDDLYLVVAEPACRIGAPHWIVHRPRPSGTPTPILALGSHVAPSQLAVLPEDEVGGDDRDGDGIVDADDGCPTLAGDATVDRAIGNDGSDEVAVTWAPRLLSAEGAAWLIRGGISRQAHALRLYLIDPEGRPVWLNQRDADPVAPSAAWSADRQLLGVVDRLDGRWQLLQFSPGGGLVPQDPAWANESVGVEGADVAPSIAATPGGWVVAWCEGDERVALFLDGPVRRRRLALGAECASTAVAPDPAVPGRVVIATGAADAVHLERSAGERSPEGFQMSTAGAVAEGVALARLDDVWLVGWREAGDAALMPVRSGAIWTAEGSVRVAAGPIDQDLRLVADGERAWAFGIHDRRITGQRIEVAEVEAEPGRVGLGLRLDPVALADSFNAVALSDVVFRPGAHALSAVYLTPGLSGVFRRVFGAFGCEAP